MAVTQTEPPAEATAAAPPTPETRSPATRSPATLAGALTIAGVVAWIVGIAVPSTYGEYEITSVLGLFTPLWETATWSVLPFVLFAPAALGLLAVAVRAGTAAASGALSGLGLASYFLVIPGLAIRLNVEGQPGIAAYVLMTTGSALVVAGGMLRYARAESRSAPALFPASGLPLAVVAVGGAGALAVFATAGLPVYPERPIALDGVLRWYAIEPIGVGAIGLAVIALGLTGFHRAAASGALAGLGGLSAVSALSTLVLVGNGPGSPEIGGFVALAGSVAMVAAGAAGLALARGRATPRPAVAPGREANEPSRLLSAAAHLDPAFAQRAVRDIMLERHRALAPSAGIALGAVLRHCVAARSRRQVRNVLLVLLTLPGLLALFNDDLWALLACTAISWGVVFAELWTARYRVAARHLALGADQAPPAHLPPGAEAVIRELEAIETSNVVVYSGYRPWVGSGAVQGGWTFAVNVRKGAEEHGGRRTPRPFTEDELHAHVADRLHATELPGLRLTDRVYVDGERVRDDRRFLEHRHGRPRTTLPGDELARADAQGPHDVVRRVRSASVVGWGGEVTFTVQLDFCIEGASLYADATYCALMPVQASYRQVDAIDPRPRLGTRLRAAGEALLTTFLLPIAPVKALKELQATGKAWRRRSRAAREIHRNPRFDYGATTSLRELAQAREYRRHFQFIDRDMFAKILEREILDAIVEFLDDHDIDTSDLEERQATVLNNGVIVTGGALSAQSLAVGQQARSSAVVEGVRRAAASATTRGGKTS